MRHAIPHRSTPTTAATTWQPPAPAATPTLRLLYDSAPYLHDGSTITLQDVLTSANPDDVHGVTSHVTEEQVEDLVAFLVDLPYCE